MRVGVILEKTYISYESEGGGNIRENILCFLSYEGGVRVDGR
jgi:hypothetical protein